MEEDGARDGGLLGAGTGRAAGPGLVVHDEAGLNVR